MNAEVYNENLKSEIRDLQNCKTKPFSYYIQHLFSETSICITTFIFNGLIFNKFSVFILT